MRVRVGLAFLLLLGMGPVLAAAPPPGERFDAQIAAARAAMMASPADAFARASTAEAVARTLPAGRPAEIAAATAEWLQGEALARQNQPQRALPILQRALATSVRVAPQEKLRGDILLSRGWVQEALGRIEPALRDFQQAFTLFRSIGEARGQAKALGNIGGIYHDAGDNDRSLRYYAEVNDVYQGDPAIAVAAYNNVGETLKALGRYPEAEAEYRKALAAAITLRSPSIEAPILTNLASTQLLRGRMREAEATARRALALASGGEAADERPFILGVLAQIAYTQGDADKARQLIDRTFAGVDLARSALPYKDFHKLAAAIYQRVGRYDLAYAHLAAFKRLDDGVRALATSTNAALMAARFDFTNQNLRITRLQAAKARQDAALARSHARLRDTVLILVVVGGSIVTGLLLFGIMSLRRSHDKVSAANARLSEVNGSLEKALRVKSEFLAMTSHEIRTPLNGILGMTQVILADTRVDHGLRDKIEVVHGAGETMRALVDDILDLAKIENGKLTVERAPMDLYALLRDAGRLWQGRAEAKGLALALELRDCPGRIDEDEARLRQIVFNLMSNAIKFTDRGSIALSAAAFAAERGELLRIEVRDTGIGIAADHQELIFEKFHQVDGGTTRLHGGTGLGLAICRSLIEAMGGTITVQSRLGEGSTFIVTLPVRRLDAPARPASPPAAARERLADAALLLVEPNLLTQRILAKNLRDGIGSLIVVRDAAEALGPLAEQRIDHLLLQAESIGEDAIAALINDARAAGAAVTILFSPGNGFSEAGLLDLGAAAAVAKPVSGAVLLARLEAVHAAGRAGKVSRPLLPVA